LKLWLQNQDSSSYQDEDTLLIEEIKKTKKTEKEESKTEKEESKKTEKEEIKIKSFNGGTSKNEKEILKEKSQEESFKVSFPIIKKDTERIVEIFF
jgi:hypothetical protein